MSTFCPKHVTFDCHDTRINFQMAGFIRSFPAHRIDKVMRDLNPCARLVHNAHERTCPAYSGCKGLRS